jgi:hypothetical protein
MVNTLPRYPTLSCRKSTGPGETILMRIGTARSSGERTMRAKTDPVISTARFHRGIWNRTSGSRASIGRVRLAGGRQEDRDPEESICSGSGIFLRERESGGGNFSSPGIHEDG